MKVLLGIDIIVFISVLLTRESASGIVATVDGKVSMLISKNCLSQFYRQLLAC